jgi:hypothetical protein
LLNRFDKEVKFNLATFALDFFAEEDAHVLGAFGGLLFLEAVFDCDQILKISGAADVV